MRALRSLIPYLWRYRWTYVTGITLVVVSNFFTTLGPRFLERGIDALEQHSPLRIVILNALYMVGVALLGGVGRFGMRQSLNSGRLPSPQAWPKPRV